MLKTILRLFLELGRMIALITLLIYAVTHW